MPTDRPGGPFDAVLIVAFGGPDGPEDVRPFLANVLRGRRITPQRIEEVAHNYERFGGRSPITEITRRQAEGLKARLSAAGVPLPVYIGMRNWHPFLADTLAQMAADGIRRAVGFIAAAHHSYSSCGQYRENVRDAQRMVAAAGHTPPEVTYVSSWFDHPLFVETIAANVGDALDRLPASVRPAARIVFTAHSLPLSMARTCAYQQQLRATAGLVMQRLGREDWTLVFQSRSGRPEDPWLEPDVRDYLRDAHAKGMAAAVLVPVAFLCDHIEVLFDLDIQAAAVARELGLPLTRAATPNDAPTFLDMMADVVLSTVRRHHRFPPLALAAASPAKRT